MAQEVGNGADVAFYAATPPLECKKMIFSMAVTQGVGWVEIKEEGMKVDLIDVRRAYFHAPARRDVYIELPAEDQEEGMCGKLNMSMYGTRDAAQNWEHMYTEWLESSGFKRGVCNPCVFWNKGKNIRLVVHGDDFTLLNASADLDVCRAIMKNNTS